MRIYNKVYRFTARPLGVQYVLMPKSASTSIRYTLIQADKLHKRKPIDFVFTFVRHPLVRLVSAYREKIRTGHYHHLVSGKVEHDLSRDMGLTEFVDHLVNFYDTYNNVSMNQHFCPQSWVVNSAPDLSFVGLVENIEQDWQVLVDKGLAPLAHRNKTNNTKTWRDMLDTKTEAKARRFYHEDFSRWDWCT